jgi:hypothetical protein
MSAVVKCCGVTNELDGLNPDFDEDLGNFTLNGRRADFAAVNRCGIFLINMTKFIYVKHLSSNT